MGRAMSGSCDMIHRFYRNGKNMILLGCIVVGLRISNISGYAINRESMLATVTGALVFAADLSTKWAFFAVHWLVKKQ